jgi:hypothetical protein
VIVLEFVEAALTNVKRRCPVSSFPRSQGQGLIQLLWYFFAGLMSAETIV